MLGLNANTLLHFADIIFYSHAVCFFCLLLGFSGLGKLTSIIIQYNIELQESPVILIKVLDLILLLVLTHMVVEKKTNAVSNLIASITSYVLKFVFQFFFVREDRVFIKLEFDDSTVS